MIYGSKFIKEAMFSIELNIVHVCIEFIPSAKKRCFDKEIFLFPKPVDLISKVVLRQDRNNCTVQMTSKAESVVREMSNMV